MAEYDLTSVIGQYLDLHLVFPLFNFIEKRQMYAQKDLLKAKLDFILKTKMIAYRIETYQMLNDTQTIPADLEKQKQELLIRLKQVKEECAPLLQILEDGSYIKKLRADKTFPQNGSQEGQIITPEAVDSLYHHGKFMFECGQYATAADYLYHYRTLSTNQDKSVSALWGKFASEILMQNWEGALEDMNRLREIIDAKSFVSPLKQLQQRTWLLHWSLFIFFNHPNGRNGIIDMFFQDRYLNAIQTTCPHILRYLTTAAITNKRRRNVLKDLVKIIQQESYTYRDPITEFLEELYINFDFEAAQQKLRLCNTVLSNDFFLTPCRDEFMENARLCIFETYCRIHQKIDIGMLAEKLDMSAPEEAERWIVNLIRNARLDAKIDSAANHIIMGTQAPSVYQQVIEKTKGLSFRSHVLANNLSAQARNQNEDDGKGGAPQNLNASSEITV